MSIFAAQLYTILATERMPQPPERLKFEPSGLWPNVKGGKVKDVTNEATIFCGTVAATDFAKSSSHNSDTHSRIRV